MPISVAEAGSLGGHARAAKLSAQRLSDIARRAQKRSVASRLSKRLAFVNLPVPRNTLILSQDEIDALPIKEQKKYAHGLMRNSLNQNPRVRPKHCCLCTHGNGFQRIVAHHTDYSQPLHVSFVCNTCHMKLHAGRKNPHGRTYPT